MLIGMQAWGYRKVHVSWLIAVVCVGIIIGIVAAQYIPLGMFTSWVWFAIASVLVNLVLWRRNSYLIIVALVGGIIIGMWRGAIDYNRLAVYQNIQGGVVTISGVVSEDVDLNSRGELVLRLHNLSVNHYQFPGKILVSVNKNANIQRSDVVVVQGKMGEGFGNFSGTIYSAKLEKVQRPQPGDVALGLRDWFADSIRQAIPDPQAALGIGYLVGQRRALPPDLDEALKIAGLTHIVVASGYNLTILVRLARRMFAKISKYTAALAAGGMIASFVAITGMSPSMSRAGLIAGLSLLAWYYGRKFHPLVLLPFAAAITLLANPSYGWGDLGWQLSFAAFAGVMILAPLGQRYFFGENKPGMMRQILGETIAAQIMTLPILVLAFGQFSNVAIFANALILPLVPVAMLLTFIAGIGAVVFPAAAASVIGLPASWVLQYMIEVARYLASVPWAQTTAEISQWVAIIAYMGLVGICVYLWKATKYDLRDSNIVE